MITGLHKRKETLKVTDGSSVYYEMVKIENRLPTLVLIHGASGDTTAWNMVRDLLNKEGFSTLAMDLRGHGFSERNDTADFYQTGKIVDDILEIIKKETLTNFSLVGHCYGANIAIQTASLQPKGLSALIVINSSYKTGITTLYQKMTVLRTLLIFIATHLPKIGTAGQTDFTKYIGTGNLHLGRILATTKKNTLKSILLTYDQVLMLNTENVLHKIECPVYLISGKKDLFFPPKTIQDLHSKLKNVKTQILENANHITLLNLPKDISNEIICFSKNNGLVEV